MNNEMIIEDFTQYTKVWIENFNKGNVEYCIDAYVDDASMTVKEVGEFKGKENIGEFFAIQLPSNVSTNLALFACLFSKIQSSI